MPGDVIATRRAGRHRLHAQAADVPRTGDVVEVEAEKIGVLRNPVVDEAAQ
jgi:2-keto-4-pentenoate hydratase/2-oxohepta-3-ene-1,7-dioic acid hydratase in catechol pathway